MTSSCRVGASGYTIRRFARWLVVSPSPEGDGGEGGGDVGSTPHSRYPTTARSHPLCSLLCDIYKCVCIHIYCWWTFSARGATTQQNQSSIEQKCWQDCVCKRPKKRNKREKKKRRNKKERKEKKQRHNCEPWGIENDRKSWLVPYTTFLLHHVYAIHYLVDKCWSVSAHPLS